MHGVQIDARHRPPAANVEKPERQIQGSKRKQWFI
jgi:hypothetical protein